MTEIPVSELFDSPTGQFNNYSAPLSRGANLVGNSYFETDVTGWTTTACTNSQVTRADNSGKALRMTATGTAAMQTYTTASYAVTPGVTYAAYGELCGVFGARTYRLQINWQTSAFAFISSSFFTATSSLGYQSVVATAPSNAAYAVVVLNNPGTGSTGDYAEWDGVQLFAAQNQQQIQVQKQKHVDLRTFNNNDQKTQIVMLYLNTIQMTNMTSKYTMGDLDSAITIRLGEQWDGPPTQAIGKQTDRNNWYGIVVPCTAGVETTTTSILRAI